MNRLLLIALVWAQASWAQDDCTLNPEVRRSQLTQSLPRHVKLLSRRLDEHHFVERIRIPGGWTVQLAVGGCEHLGYTVTITGPWLSANTSSADLVAIAKQVLPRLPLNSEARVDAQLWLRVLQAEPLSPLPATLPCGEATCEMALRTVKGKSALVLSYDFVL